jgi:hypothetical protein
MSSPAGLPDNLEVRVGVNEDPTTRIEHRLQQAYGSGTYLSDFYKAESGNVTLSIGNSFPKDVSDCRPQSSRVIKYIAIDDIADLNGSYEDDNYVIELEPREEVEEGLEAGKERLRNDLDQAMAKATYKKIARTPAVENQLNPIKQILRWTRIYDGPSFEEVKKAQGKEDGKTLRYIKTLEELGFIRMDQGKLYPQDPLEKYDLGSIEDEAFNQAILGEVIEKGFKRLSRDLGLGVILNLPKFANGYYVDAIERQDPRLHLDTERIQNNMIDLYGYSASYHPYELQDKLSLLTSLEILERDDEGYFTAQEETYEQMNVLAPV